MCLSEQIRRVSPQFPDLRIIQHYRLSYAT